MQCINTDNWDILLTNNKKMGYLENRLKVLLIKPL